MGESSSGPLLELSLRRCRGYGDPKNAGSSCSAGGAETLDGGVRRSCATRSGSLGAGSAGSLGDGSPSAVDAVDKAGDVGDSGAWVSSKPASAGPVDGSRVDVEEDVFEEPEIQACELQFPDEPLHQLVQPYF